MKSLTNRSFDKNIQRERYAAVLFFANCCGPSRVAEEIFRASAKKRRSLAFFTVNVDREEELAKRCGIEILPAALFFKRGEVILASYGVSSSQKLNDIIDRLIK